MYQPTVRLICPACDGRKVQKNKDGIKVRCPMCGGSGYITEGGSGIEFICSVR